MEINSDKSGQKPRPVNKEAAQTKVVAGSSFGTCQFWRTPRTSQPFGSLAAQALPEVAKNLNFWEMIFPIISPKVSILEKSVLNIPVIATW